MVRVLWWILEMLGLQSSRHQDIHWISKVSACQLKPVTPWCQNPTSSEFASLRVSKTCWGHQPLRIPQAVFWHQNLEILVRLWNNKWDLDDEYTGRFVFSWTTIQSQKCDFETNNARSGRETWYILKLIPLDILEWKRVIKKQITCIFLPFTKFSFPASRGKRFSKPAHQLQESLPLPQNDKVSFIAATYTAKELGVLGLVSRHGIVVVGWPTEGSPLKPEAGKTKEH